MNAVEELLGGRPGKDGTEAMCPSFNIDGIPSEINEHSYPVLVPVPGSADQGLRTWNLRHLTLFFGMIAAHFDDYETLPTPDAGGASLQGVRTKVH